MCNNSYNVSPLMCIYIYLIGSVSLENPDNADIIINAPHSLLEMLDTNKCHGIKRRAEKGERGREASSMGLGGG